MRGFTFFWGAASGSARKALRQLEEPNVCINYATKLNEPWDGIERLFVDPGGYSFLHREGEYKTSDSEYLDFVERVNPERFGLRDYPCVPDLLTPSSLVEDQQRKTTEHHVAVLDEFEERQIDACPVATLQGWWADDYVEHIYELKYAGVLDRVRHVAIGSLVGRDDPQQVRHIVLKVRDALPSKYHLHAWGAKVSVLKDRETLAALDSADSNSFDFEERKERTRGGGPGRTFRDVARVYLEHKASIKRIVSAMEHDDPAELRDRGQVGLEEVGRA